MNKLKYRNISLDSKILEKESALIFDTLLSYVEKDEVFALKGSSVDKYERQFFIYKKDGSKNKYILDSIHNPPNFSSLKQAYRDIIDYAYSLADDGGRFIHAPRFSKSHNYFTLEVNQELVHVKAMHDLKFNLEFGEFFVKDASTNHDKIRVCSINKYQNANFTYNTFINKKFYDSYAFFERSKNGNDQYNLVYTQKI